MKTIKLTFILFLLVLSLIVSSATADEKKMLDNWGIIYGISDTLINETTVDFDIKLLGNKFYFNNQSFLITRNTMPAKDFFINNNIEQTYFDLKEQQELLAYNYNIKLNDSITYLQFDKTIDNSLLKQYVTQNRQVILLDDILLLFGKNGEPVFYSKPYFEKAFIKDVPQLPIIAVPFNADDAFILYRDEVLKKLSIHYKNFLDLPWSATDIYGAKFSPISSIINPIFIDVFWDSGEADSFLYLFSSDYKVLDKLLIFSYITTTRGGPGGDGQAVGYRYFTIDKNYFIERRQRFEDETMEIQHFQVTNKGKFQELPTTSNCYREFAIKDKSQHSAQSLLLTSNQANNYLRFDGGRLDELDDVTLTFNPNEKTLCVNYQQAYSVTFGKANSKQFFDNEALYQQQVENFKKYHIDISNELEYVTFENIDEQPIAKFLLNGNQAIYMNNTLFIVGKDYFVAYRQPTKEELVYTQ
ncbi:hypothetical protein A9G34_02070 [Gilliamella sp. Choc4-2]|uniref:hypothetical protein n=1 Tax=unclassified Gilliamella TaxID=2685620 RepID=UPI0004DCFC22|nr:hypothetical protein [Gilliamella apicola]KFA57986.1 hypothetical protein GAPWKB11_1957 [Gilliamella apicola]OCG43228.1 hypothetical protein A9G34_02070 [Gilliamella apicola]OCG61774.1 hypothetical protein A9G48_09740 [Gilliamella apicola]